MVFLGGKFLKYQTKSEASATDAYRMGGMSYSSSERSRGMFILRHSSDKDQTLFSTAAASGITIGMLINPFDNQCGGVQQPFQNSVENIEADCLISLEAFSGATCNESEFWPESKNIYIHQDRAFFPLCDLLKNGSIIKEKVKVVENKLNLKGIIAAGEEFQFPSESHFKVVSFAPLIGVDGNVELPYVQDAETRKDVNEFCKKYKAYQNKMFKLTYRSELDSGEYFDNLALFYPGDTGYNTFHLHNSILNYTALPSTGKSPSPSTGKSPLPRSQSVLPKSRSWSVSHSPTRESPLTRESHSTTRKSPTRESPSPTRESPSPTRESPSTEEPVFFSRELPTKKSSTKKSPSFSRTPSRQMLYDAN